MNKTFSKFKRGFSLLEVLIGVTLMAVIGGTIYPSAMNYIEKSKYQSTQQNQKVISEAIAKATDEGYSLPQPVDADGNTLPYGKVGYLNGRGLVGQVIKDVKLNDKGILFIDGNGKDESKNILYVTDTSGKYFAIGTKLKDYDSNKTLFNINTNFPVPKTDDTLFGKRYLAETFPNIGDSVKQLAVGTLNVPNQEVSIFFSNIDITNGTIDGKSADQIISELKIVGPSNTSLSFSGSAFYSNGTITIGYSGTPVDGMKVTNNNSSLLGFDAYFGAKSTDTLTQTTGGSTTPVGTCTPSSVTNGLVGSYPTCAITCNSGFHLNGSSCEADVVTPQDGQAGNLNGQTISYEPNQNTPGLCNIGTVTNFSNFGTTYSWTCTGNNGGLQTGPYSLTYNPPVCNYGVPSIENGWFNNNYPSCTISCNPGYHADGMSCVINASYSILYTHGPILYSYENGGDNFVVNANTTVFQYVKTTGETWYINGNDSNRLYKIGDNNPQTNQSVSNFVISPDGQTILYTTSTYETYIKTLGQDSSIDGINLYVQNAYTIKYSQTGNFIIAVVDNYNGNGTRELVKFTPISYNNTTVEQITTAGAVGQFDISKDGTKIVYDAYGELNIKSTNDHLNGTALNLNPGFFKVNPTFVKNDGSRIAVSQFNSSGWTPSQTIVFDVSNKSVQQVISSGNGAMIFGATEDTSNGMQLYYSDPTDSYNLKRVTIPESLTNGAIINGSYITSQIGGAFKVTEK